MKVTTHAPTVRKSYQAELKEKEGAAGAVKNKRNLSFLILNILLFPELYVGEKF